MKLNMRWMTNQRLFVAELGKLCSCAVKHEFCHGANTVKAKVWSRQWVGAVLTVVRQIVEQKDPLRFRDWAGGVQRFRQLSGGADEWAPDGDRFGLEVCFVDIDRSETAWKELLGVADVLMRS